MAEPAWEVLIIDEAVDELEVLSIQVKAKFQHIVGLIEDFGLPAVGEPHIKHLEDKIWEMRMFNVRALYFVASDERVIVVRAFVKKRQTTPRREIALARRRMDNWQDE